MYTGWAMKIGPDEISNCHQQFFNNNFLLYLIADLKITGDKNRRQLRVKSYNVLLHEFTLRKSHN